MIYNPHTLTPIVRHTDGKYVGCFIDIGIRNMCIRFSKFDPESGKIEGIHNQKFDFDYSKGNKRRKAVLDERLDIGKAQDKFAQLTQEFSKLRDTFSTCHYIVMEKQLGTTDNVEVSEYTLGLLSGLIMDRGSRPIIIKLDSRVKTKMLDMPRGKDPKMWCLNKSVEILSENIGECDWKLSKDILIMPTTGTNKSLDIADVVCYCWVFWNRYILRGRVDKPS